MRPRHLIDEWHARFVLELRGREVPGPRIGDLLAEVDTHCRDTGEDPATAFGDPIAYAREAAGAEGTRSTSHWGVAARAVAPLAASFAVLAGVDAMAHGGSAVVSAGDLLAVALGTLAVTVLMAMLDRVASDLRWALVLGASFTAVVLASVLWSRPVAHAPGWPLLLGGAAVLTAALWPRAADRILDPRTGREPFGRSRAATAVLWAPVVLLAVAALLTAVLPG